MGILIIIGKVLITVLIVIFSLFLLALLLVGLVLFVPVRYKVVLEQEPAIDGGKLIESFFAKGIISWCLFVVRLPFSFENSKGNYQIRVLGIDIKKLKEKFPKRRKIKKDKKIKNNGKKSEIAGKSSENTVKSVIGENDAEEKIMPDAEIKESVNVENTDIEIQEIKGKRDKNNHDRANVKDNSIWRRIKGFFVGISTRFADIWNKFKHIIEKIKKLPSVIREKKKKAKSFIELLKSDMVKESICVVWENVVHLWSNIKPRNIKGRVHFGTSDPCLTGQILGGVAVFMGMTGLYIEITPDFEESVLEGRIEIKGRLQFVTLLKIIVRLYRDENIKKVAGEFGLF